LRVLKLDRSSQRNFGPGQLVLSDFQQDANTVRFCPSGRADREAVIPHRGRGGGTRSQCRGTSPGDRSWAKAHKSVRQSEGRRRNEGNMNDPQTLSWKTPQSVTISLHEIGIVGLVFDHPITQSTDHPIGETASNFKYLWLVLLSFNRYFEPSHPVVMSRTPSRR
jgi:hypothetical protein